MVVDESARARPSAALRPYVAHYSGWRQVGVPSVTHRGLPSPYLTLVLTLDDPLVVLGALGAEQVRELIRAAPHWPGRFAAVDAALLALARRGAAEAHPDVTHAFGRLLATGGHLPVRALAGETGWSARHLTDRFRVETGLGLKEAARVVRFDRARRRLTPRTRLADLAADAGYYDQAHLTREFRAMAGCSPSRWLTDEFAFVQDVPAPRGEDGSHG